MPPVDGVETCVPKHYATTLEGGATSMPLAMIFTVMKPIWSPRLALLALSTVVGAGSLGAQWTNDDCLACHDGLTDDDGQPVAADLARFTDSIHGQLDLACIDCHTDLADVEDLPHDTPLAPAACGDCHVDEAETHATSIHGRTRPGETLTAATCGACHGSHDILPSDDAASRTSHFHVPETCGGCHRPEGDAGQVDPRFAVAPTYDDSIHGHALLNAGLVVAPNCATCHGVHDILPPQEAGSRVSRAHIPGTCGSCHVGIERQYSLGVHGKAAAGGDDKAPICADCHSAHSIVRADLPGWRRSVIEECGSCHEHAIETYRDTYHGKISSLGGSRVAACADCHGAHRIEGIEAAANPAAQETRLHACRQCHAGAGASFARYDPHPDPDDRERNPVLYWSARGMKSLLVFVFSFFFLHTGLWMHRSLRGEKRDPKVSEPGESP